jgi:parallel beta-helix repeat protein
VSGFVFTSDPYSAVEQPAIWIDGGHHIDLSGNEIRDARRSGIFVSDAKDVQMLGNYIHDNGTRPRLDHGIYFGSGKGGLIANNLIVANKAIGIQLYPDADGVIVTQNTICDNGRVGVLIGGHDSTAPDKSLIVNNIIAFNGVFGIRSLWDGSVGDGNIARMNLLFDNGQSDLDVQGLASVDNVIGDPRFINRDARDFRLANDSPALGGAVPDFSMVVDFTGHPRPTPAALGALDHG